MKKFTFLAAIAVVLTVFNGCQKEESVVEKGLPEFVSPKYEPEFGKFKEEIIVYDASGENSLFLALHAGVEEDIKEYLKNFKLELVIGPDWNNTMLKSGTMTEKKQVSDIALVPKMALQRKVTVEFLANNLKDKNQNYNLSVTKIKIDNENKLKSADFSYGQYTDYVTTEDFLGACRTSIFQI